MSFLLALFAVGFLLGGIALFFSSTANVLHHIAGILCAIGFLLSLTANAVLTRLDRLASPGRTDSTEETD